MEGGDSDNKKRSLSWLFRLEYKLEEFVEQKPLGGFLLFLLACIVVIIVVSFLK